MSLEEAIKLAGEMRDLRGLPDDLLANRQRLFALMHQHAPDFTVTPAEIERELRTRINERALDYMPDQQKLVVRGYLDAEDGVEIRPTPEEMATMFEDLEDNDMFASEIESFGGALNREDMRIAQRQAVHALSGEHNIYKTFSAEFPAPPGSS
jgi:hypothetical protein